MAILRGVLPGMLLVAAGAAQQRIGPADVVQILDVADVITNVERFAGREPPPGMRLHQLLATAFAAGPKELQDLRGGSGPADRLVLVGSTEQLQEIQALLAQLRRPDLQELRLQCTQVTLPRSAVATSGLAVGKLVEVDEVAAGKVLKAALAAKGTLHNLPEAGVLPLQPCAMRVPRREGRAAAEPFAHGEVLVQALPLGADEAWFGLKWRGETQGAIGAGQAAAAGAEPQFDAAVRLQAGKGAMVMSLQGQHAVVLWVRFCFTRAAQPAHDQPQGKGR